MLGKVLAVVSLVVLPLSALLWHQSHNDPAQHRYDLTLYKSLRVYLKDGVCGLRMISLPTKTASRTAFHAPLTHDATPKKRSLMLSSTRKGVYRVTWVVFPLWLTTGALTVLGALPVIRGPVRRRWREWKGHCVECGYNLTGNRSGRCSECGHRFR